jgi:hypothetical protein
MSPPSLIPVITTRVGSAHSVAVSCVTSADRHPVAAPQVRRPQWHEPGSGFGQPFPPMSGQNRAAQSPGAAGGDRRPPPGRRTAPGVRPATLVPPCQRRARRRSWAGGSMAVYWASGAWMAGRSRGRLPELSMWWQCARAGRRRPGLRRTPRVPTAAGLCPRVVCSAVPPHSCQARTHLLWKADFGLRSQHVVPVAYLG